MILSRNSSDKSAVATVDSRESNVVKDFPREFRGHLSPELATG
jgi:hypothetical protein